MSLRAAMVVTLVAALVAPARAQVRRDEGEKVEEEPAPQLTRAPELIEGAAPVYPPPAEEAGLEAVVKIRIHIAADGTVTKVDVLEPVGHGFDEAAVDAAMQYRFTPAEFDGVPGPVAVETAMHFVLRDGAGDDGDEDRGDDDDEDGDGDDEDVAVPAGPPERAGDPSQPVTIAGRAVERGTRRPLTGVIVSIVELQLDAVTDADGRFYFHGVPAGSYRILAVDDRYDRFERALELEPDKAADVVLWMRPRGGDPYETVVEGERDSFEVTKRTLERKQLTTVPGTFGDPIRVIQALPGLARTPFVTGFLVIRGSNPDDTGVYIDGHEIPLLFHFLGGPSILHPEFLESIDLYPGGFPARFGRAIGGIVEVESRRSASDGVHGSADVDLLDSSAYVRFPIGEKASMALAARRSYLDLVLTAFLPEPDPGGTLIVTPVYYDYQARFDYDLEEEGRASLFLLGSFDALDVVQRDAGEEQSLDLGSSISFFRLISSYRRVLAATRGGALELTISPAIGRDAVRFDSGQIDADAPFTRADITQETFSYRMRITGPLREWISLDAGVDLESRVTRYDVVLPLVDDVPILGDAPLDVDPEQLVRSIDLLGVGLHADVAVDVTGDLRVVPGVRADGYFLAGKRRGSVDPRLLARYRIGDAWAVKGYVGLFSQAPAPEGLDSRFGNPALGLERAAHYGLGGEWKPARHWAVDAEAYYIRRDELARFTDEVIEEEDGDVQPLHVVNSGDGDTYGVELLVKREVTEELYGWLSYTLSWSRERREAGNPYDPTFFDQRHTLNLVASYRFPRGVELGGRFRLVTGRPTTEVVGATFDADTGAYVPVESDFGDAREATFHQLDARVEKTWLFHRWSFALYLDVQNLYNADNPEATQYDYRFRDSVPVRGVPFLPTLGVKGQF